MIRKEEVLNGITSRYLHSHDFNGFPVWNFLNGFDWQRLKETLSELIRDDKISLVFGDRHPNPAIKAFNDEDKEVQIEKLQKISEADLNYLYAYPSKQHLISVVDQSQYQGRPFTLRLALGEPKLSFVSFELSVLEFYRNDPRYTYESSDIDGWISIRNEYYVSDEIPESDKIVIAPFGFAYDSDFNRAVAVLLTDLSQLSPQHQQIWNAKKLEGDYKLHPMFVKTKIVGDFSEGIPIFMAFGEELHHINEMSKLMRRPPLFKNDYRESKMPRGFGFLIRPTLKEYNDFVQLLDKAITDNINREFFLKDLSFEYEEVRKDGKVVIRHKNPIRILDEWLRLKWRTDNWKPIHEMVEAFKEIRRLRNRPSHVIENDVFDQKYFKEQRNLIIKAYDAVRMLRIVFSKHPNVKGYKIPEDLEKGPIWDR